MAGKRRAEESGRSGGEKGQRSIRCFFAPAVGRAPPGCADGACEGDSCAAPADCQQLLPDRVPPPAATAAAAADPLPACADSCHATGGSGAVPQPLELHQAASHVVASASEERGEAPAMEAAWQPMVPLPAEPAAAAAQQQQQQQQQKEQPLAEQQGDVSHSMAAGAPAAPHAAEAAEPAGGDRGATAASGGGGLTAYELQRLERIRRNQEMMVSMGLGEPGIERKQPAAAAAPRRPARRRVVAPGGGGGGPPAPVRRSGRNRGPAGGAGSEDAAAVAAAAAAAEEPPPEPELQFDDSSVRRYVCEVLATDDAAAVAAEAAGVPGSGGAAGGGDPSGSIAGFRQLPGCLSDPALARAYSVDWRPGLVAAGGKDGVVSVWGSREAEAGRLAAGAAVPPLLSGKLHKGWIAEVQFLSAAGSDACTNGGSGSGSDGLLRLLTAGNDGAVCLWDLGRAAEAGGRGGVVPQCLVRATDLHAGGIFSLHERGGRLLTASKDACVTVSSLGEGGGAGGSLAVLQRYEELHTGVVKCARWRDDHCFASCGNDRQLVLVDTRQPTSAGLCCVVEGAHGSAINCLRWHPSDQHLLLSSSHDPAALIHDMRSPGQPLHRLLGHAQAARIGSIYQPAWVAGGAAVATGCERSTLLSLYCARTGTAISRGDAGLSPGATLCCGATPGDPLLVSAARSVLLFAPA